MTVWRETGAAALLLGRSCLTALRIAGFGTVGGVRGRRWLLWVAAVLLAVISPCLPMAGVANAQPMDRLSGSDRDPSVPRWSWCSGSKVCSVLVVLRR